MREFFKNEKSGYGVNAFYITDNTTMRKEIGILIKDPHGNYSDMFHIKRSRLASSGSCLNFLMDTQGDFTIDDINKIYDGIKAAINKCAIDSIDMTAKVSFKEVYDELCNYADEHQEEDVIRIQDGYCFIDSKKFSSIVNQLDFGYTRIEILKKMKFMGLLQINKNRHYDYALTDKDGNTYRTISFKYKSKQDSPKEEKTC